MYARSYEKNTREEEGTRILPSGYSGVAFESEPAETPAPEMHCPKPEPLAACAPAPCEDTCEEEDGPAALPWRIPFLQKIKIPHAEGFSLGSLFSDTEDLLLLGMFLLLLFSKEGDFLCAAAILILFFTGKD